MTAGDGGRIHGWWNQFHRGIQQTGMATTHTIFLVMERRSKKNIDLRSQLKCGGVSGGVKGQDEREERALDPAAHASEVVRLDNSQRRHTRNDNLGWWRCARGLCAEGQAKSKGKDKGKGRN